MTAAVILRLFIQKHQTNPTAPHQMQELINIAPPDNNLVIMTAGTGFLKGLCLDFLFAPMERRARASAAAVLHPELSIRARSGGSDAI